MNSGETRKSLPFWDKNNNKWREALQEVINVVVNRVKISLLLQKNRMINDMATTIITKLISLVHSLSLAIDGKITDGLPEIDGISEHMEMGNTEFIINCINSGMNRKFPGSFDVSEILKGIGVEIEEGYTNFLRIMEKIIDLNFREKIQLFNTIWNCSCLPSKGPYKIPILVTLIQRYETNALHKEV